MNISKVVWFVGKIPFVSSILRWYMRSFPEGSVVTIAYGRAAGYKWRRYHRYVNGYWIGQFELPIQQALVQELSKGNTFFDIGANAGFFTLVAAKQVGPNGKCIAFEPLPENATCIREQITLNELNFCHVVEEAVSDHEGYASFSYDRPGTSTAHLGNTKEGERSIQVKLSTLDATCRKWGYPDFIKMDIEGGEVDALKGASDLLSKYHPRLLIELHGEQCEQGVKDILRRFKYSFFDLYGKKIMHDNPLPHHFIAKIISNTPVIQSVRQAIIDV